MASEAIMDEVASPPPKPDTSVLDALVGYRLRRVQNAVVSDFMAAVGELGLRPSLFAAIAIIAENPGLIQMSLGKALGIQRANLVPLLNEMCDRGLVERQPAAHDRRALALRLTEAGRVLFAQALARVRAHEAQLLAGLSRTEQDQLLKLLLKIG